MSWKRFASIPVLLTTDEIRKDLEKIYPHILNDYQCHAHSGIIYQSSLVILRFTHFACQNLYYDCSQNEMDMENDDSSEQLDGDEGDESDEEDLDDDENDKDGDETDVEDDGSQEVKSSDPRFKSRRLLRKIQRIGRRVVPKFRIRPLKRKIRRNGHGVYPKYRIIRFLRRLRRKDRHNRFTQRKIRRTHRKVKNLANKIRLLQRKIRRIGRPKKRQRRITFF